MSIINSSQYLWAPKILGVCVANFQKNIGTSSFSGTILTWAVGSNYFCGPAEVPPPDANGTFSPSSNRAGCLFLKSLHPISSVKVEPDETTNYVIQFYSDTGCSNKVVSATYSGVNCEVPTAGTMAFTINYEVAIPSIRFTEPGSEASLLRYLGYAAAEGGLDRTPAGARLDK
jgi:hypothetical protein